MDPNAANSELVLTLDFGSQHTHLITRRIRSLNIFSLCISGASSLEAINALNPRVVILSGGPHSVHTPDSPAFPDGFLEWAQKKRIFVLGICYGLQLLVKKMGGEVAAGDSQEYGRIEIEVEGNGGIFGSKKVGDRQFVWMSHGDEVERLPEGFEVVARSVQGGAVAAVENREMGFYGLQYHPEFTGYLYDVCGVTADWRMENVMDEEIQAITSTVGPEDHVICALSGCVESTVAATLVHKAIGDRLHCIFVDNGSLRYEEKERVMETLEQELHLPVTCVDASVQFLSALKGVVDDGEKKMEIIRKEFIGIFDAFVNDLEQELGKRPGFLVQGTLYPDVMESSPPPGSGRRTHSHTMKLIEPLKLLFKDEVLELGKILNVPEGFLKRQPFSGPAFAVRVKVNDIFIQSIKDAGLSDRIWQASAVFVPNWSVDDVVALRAVTSQDGVTFEWYQFEREFLEHVARKICNSVRGVNRVIVDISSKPPSTIEWE